MDSIEQAQKIYALCVGAAKMGKTLKYREVLDHLGYKPRATGQVIRSGLKLAGKACAEKKLPKLTCIIVTKASGKPSKEYQPELWEKDVKIVFCHKDWPSVHDIDWQYIWDHR
jgi:hypothetical protein